VWAAVTYSTALVAAIGFFAWQRGASRLGANKVLVYQYLITLVGAFSGVMLLGEGLGVQKIVGGAIIRQVPSRRKLDPASVEVLVGGKEPYP
jgi:drug/metabolite transporter (DMT)-like permease